MTDRKVYEQVDVKSLVTALAEEAWLQETNRWKDANKLTEDDLYETILIAPADGNNPILEKQVKPHWASTFFAIRGAYEELVEQYILKPQLYEQESDI